MPKSTYVYVTYIRTSPEELWRALTDPSFMSQYWFGSHGESEWTPGSNWKLVGADGKVSDAGQIVESDPPRRLVIRWRHMTKPELVAEGDSVCEMELEQADGAVKLSITHSVQRDPSKLVEAVSGGWPKILSNLKSLLETGRVALLTAYPAAAK
jgi:uncharacterized protein YndB with AHSA1/START domain